MRYALKKIRNITGKDITTGKNKFILSDLKTATITGSSETVWADGQDGTHLVGFDVNKVAGLTADNGSIDIGYLETQTGGVLRKVTGGNAIMFAETLTVSLSEDQATATTSHKASGAAGSEIKFVYPFDETGDPDRLNACAQAASATAQEFAYDPETKKITLPTGKFTEGDRIYVEYFPSFTSYQELDNDADRFSETVAVYVNLWLTDICTKKDIPAQMVLPAGKVSGEISYQLGDQAAVQSLSIDAMTTCGEKSLWKLYKYDMSEITD
ncbi:MAG TPA: hypothetical protein IAB98_11340 [Candidatus Egerieimonas intestinavium]|uniref:Major tail protein n=1 Tax=Candidatus Egerieimonas intestinavium TaxID=2840777 RepID=A0A9D1JGH0_9FIRM|nr:hypothetical protein [Candidatus Egerieimonas intestinavium]